MYDLDEVPQVSVVVPCLNRAHFLPQTLESILGQTGARVECIVIDGGSTDGSQALLASYGDRIRWLSEPDGGHADAINKGWRLARGDILAWLNADDVWELPDAVSRVLAFFEADPDADIIYGDCGAIDAEGARIGWSYSHDWDLEYAVLNCDHCIPQPAAFIRRRVIDRVGYLDTAFYQKKDHDFWLRAGLGGKIRHVDAVLAHARHHAGNFGYQGDATARACVQLTRKFFANPALPASLRRLQHRALSNAYLRGALYIGGYNRDYALATRYVLRALQADVSNYPACSAALRNHTIDGFLRRSDSAHLAPMLRRGLAATAPTAQRVASAATRLAQPEPNLEQAREIELSWLAGQLGGRRGRLLAVGGTDAGHLWLAAARRGQEVTVADQGATSAWLFEHPRLQRRSGDFASLALPAGAFDEAVFCLGTSTSLVPSNAADAAVLARLRGPLRRDGRLLLTLPIGSDRGAYDPTNLREILTGWKIEAEEYWSKPVGNTWRSVSRDAALGQAATSTLHALGCYVLRKLEETPPRRRRSRQTTEASSS